MSILSIVLFVVGLVLLTVGADFLVRGAGRLALALGISPLVVGLTVVAFGTSAPELAVSVKAALDGATNIAVGNVVGSNIFNILFILGASAVITPLIISRQLITLDVPVMIGASALAYWMAQDLTISRTEGIILVVALAGYTTFLIVKSLREGKAAASIAEVEELGPVGKTTMAEYIRNIFFIIVGLGMLVLGSHWLVQTAVEFARAFGISELVIGLTIVAAGTSLPEVATSLMAAFKGERDIAVGNVVGSNTFNLLCVLGVSSIVAPLGVDAGALALDIPVMVAIAAFCLPIFIAGHCVSRGEGLVFVGYYVVYAAYIILVAKQSPALASFIPVVMYGFIPLTTLYVLGRFGYQIIKGPVLPAK